MSGTGTGADAGGDAVTEETWHPAVARWHYDDEALAEARHDPEDVHESETVHEAEARAGAGDYVLPRALRALPPPWDRLSADWPRITELPRTGERLAEARHVLDTLLDSPETAPYAPQPPAPGLLVHAWEELQGEIGTRMPRASDVTWTAVDALVRERRAAGGLYPLQERALGQVEAVLLDLTVRLRDDIADSVFGWLELDPRPARFEDWAVPLAERCTAAGIGADSAIDLLGAIGTAAARAALERLAVKPGGPAGWNDAEAALGMLAELDERHRRDG